MGRFALKAGERVEFIGDSITDCGRRQDPAGLGQGYVSVIRNLLAAHRPNCPVEIINRGVGGDRVVDLAARWDEDVLAVAPAWLSISIGINDVWRAVTPGMEADAVPLDRFIAVYRELLEKTRGDGIRLVLMEPTLVGDDPAGEGNRLLAGYVKAVGQMARDFEAILVPTHAAFLRLRRERPELDLTVDGAHPTPLGHTVMAVTWLRAVGLFEAPR